MAMEPVPSRERPDLEGSDRDPLEAGRGQPTAVRQIVAAVDQQSARPPVSRSVISQPPTVVSQPGPLEIQPPVPRRGESDAAGPPLTRKLSSAVDGSPRSYPGAG